MPRKPAYKPRRPTRKPALATAKKVVAKSKKAMAKKNMDTFYLSAKNVGVIVPAQGVTVANYVYFSPILLDQSNTWSVTNNSEFKMYQSLYDKVRINSITLTYTPKANVLDATAGQNDTAYTLTGDGAIHTAIDRDSTIPANIARVSRYPSYQRYSLLKKFTRTYKITYPPGVWLDCQNIFEDGTLLKRLGLTGSIGLYAENIVEDRLEIFNEPLAECQLSYNCVFQGKVSSSISVSDAGVITITPDTEVLVAPTQTFTTVRGTTSDRRWDMSGNLVAVSDSDLP